jgi:hypothetical protein
VYVKEVAIYYVIRKTTNGVCVLTKVSGEQSMEMRRNVAKHVEVLRRLCDDCYFLASTRNCRRRRPECDTMPTNGSGRSEKSTLLDPTKLAYGVTPGNLRHSLSIVRSEYLRVETQPFTNTITSGTHMHVTCRDTHRRKNYPGRQKTMKD